MIRDTHASITVQGYFIQRLLAQFLSFHAHYNTSQYLNRTLTVMKHLKPLANVLTGSSVLSCEAWNEDSFALVPGETSLSVLLSPPNSGSLVRCTKVVNCRKWNIINLLCIQCNFWFLGKFYKHGHAYSQRYHDNLTKVH